MLLTKRSTGTNWTLQDLTSCITLAAEGRRLTGLSVPDAQPRHSSSLFRRGSLVGVTPDARRGSVLLDNRAPHATTALKVRAAQACVRSCQAWTGEVLGQGNTWD